LTVTEVVADGCSSRTVLVDDHDREGAVGRSVEAKASTWSGLPTEALTLVSPKAEPLPS